MKQRIVRGARYAASLAVGMAHMLLALWAGSAAGGWAWRHGYTLPYDTSSSAAMSAAIVFGLLAAGAVVTLPEPWMTQVRFLVRGRPLLVCEGCGGLISTVDHNNDVNTTPKEITQ
ncbi:hypothetical protein [Streptomyces sp. SID5910]|uniref:hypothetical protein n=1 Tax=Streptomyces sp. SID5910 TaxID=2690312 RepID=UPI001367ED14|nr:hypothetical protein [Streptomyces sp. SID5910]MYR41247.1 hypothetical protein [Streptomyces sp. SID5910]